MRVLVSTTAGAGHFGPMVPFARALVDAGHDVVVAAPASFEPTVARAGFAFEPFADADPEVLGKVFAGLDMRDNRRGNRIVIREVFGRIDAQAALPGMRAIVERWQPDLVLREATEFASHAVAEAAGVPTVQVGIGLHAAEEEFFPDLEDALAELGSTRGVAGLMATPRVALTPESMEEPGMTGSNRTTRYRDPASTSPTGEALPSWWKTADLPLVYVTFGSVAGSLGLFPDLYRAVVEALADEPIRVLLTIGDAGDVAELGTLPPSTHAENWWPQQQVMHHADAMVGHGGYGTTLIGLAAGMPMVCVPLFADQPANADRVQAMGAGVTLEGGPEGVAGLASAVRRVLTQDAYRTAAQAVADEIAALPPVTDAVPLLASRLAS